MQHITIIRSKYPGGLSDEYIKAAGERIRESIPFRQHILAERSFISDSKRIAAYWFSNEPDAVKPERNGNTLALLQGYPLPPAEISNQLTCSSRLHHEISELPGRFSAAVIDLSSGDVAAATTITRVDPFYHGDDEKVWCIGNWAGSVAAVLNNGQLQYENNRIFGFLNSGHFIEDETFYKNVDALPPYACIHLKENAASISSDFYPTLIGSLQAQSPGNLVDEIAEALIDACRSIPRSDKPITLNLSGGKDSRILLAAFLASGLEVEARTYSGGSSNQSDVYVASLVAKTVGVKHEVQPYSAPPLAGQNSVSVDFYKRNHDLLNASDAHLAAWVSLPFSPKFKDISVLNGLGGELMRGGHASKADQNALALRPPSGTLLKRWGKFKDRFNKRLQDEFDEHVNAWMHRFEGHGINALVVADYGYLTAKMGRWGSAITRPGALSRKVFYPFLDNRLVSLVYRLPADYRFGDKLIHSLVSRLEPRLIDIPIAYDAWKCLPEKVLASERELHPLAYVPRGKGAGQNTDWRMNWRALLPEMHRQYLEKADDELRAMLNDKLILELLKGDATDNDRYLLFSIYAATMVRSGGLQKPSEEHPVTIPL